MTSRSAIAAALACCVAGAACDLLDPVVRLLDPEPRGHLGAETDVSTLIVGVPADALRLDPARIADDESVAVCEQLYERLVRYEPGSTEVQPGLAESWDVSDEGRLWTFRLRHGVRFHDGTPLDAEAVVFSFERQRDPRHPHHEPDFGYWDGQFDYIQEIRALDARTVAIRIERPYAPFLSSLAMYPVSIVSPTAVRRWGKDFAEHPVGTGPFKLASWSRNDRIVLERNDEYWGEKARLERIVFRSIPDARQRLVALEGGAVHVAFSILPEELQYVRLHTDLRLLQVPVANVVYLAMNNGRRPFDDVGVRRAVNHAINKVPIVKLIYQGLAVPALGPLPPSLWSYRADVTTYPYDPVLARALLEEAAKAGRLDLRKRYRLFVPRTPRPYLPEPEQVARVIQRNLQDVGFDVELVLADMAIHEREIRSGKHDLCLLGWTADNGDPDNFLRVLLDFDPLATRPQENVAFYRSAEVHGLLRYAEETIDRHERTTFYERAQALIAQDAPWVPLAHTEMAVATRVEVMDLSIHPIGTVSYHRVWLNR